MSGFIWSNENVFKLIELFQDRELLWNTQIDAYKDRNKKHEAWMQIANEFNLDRHSIEKKIRSLVGQFQRESKKSKSSADDVSKWFAYKKLLFLKDRNKPEETVDGGLSVSIILIIFNNNWMLNVYHIYLVKNHFSLLWHRLSVFLLVLKI